MASSLIDFSYLTFVLFGLVGLAVIGFFFLRAQYLAKSQEDQKKYQRSQENYSALKLMLDMSQEAYVIHDEFQPIFANNTFVQMFGYQAFEEILQIGSIDSLLSEDARMAFLQVWDNLEIGAPPRVISRLSMYQASGGDFWVSAKIQKIHWDGRDLIQTNFLDITEQMSYEMELEFNRAKHEDSASELVAIAEELDIALRRAKDARLFQEKLIDTVPNLIYVKNRDEVFVQCNAAFCKFVRKSKEEILDQPVSTIFDHQEIQVFNQNEEGLIETRKQNKFDASYQLKSQQASHFIVYKSVYTNTYNEVDGIITICVEITDRKIFENELRRLATVDPLTGCFNRRRYLELANMEFVRAERYNLSLCVMMLDIDHFKSINDTFGHAVGDEALIKLAKVVKGMIRDTDIFGRFGGEEFALLLPNTSLKDGHNIAERVRDTIGEIKLTSNDEVITFTVSIGLTHYLVKMDDTISKALQRADEALYVAKKSGRNKVVLSEVSSNIETILQAAG